MNCIPFNRARFCSDCECITEMGGKLYSATCPNCGSFAWVPLSRWLDREPTKSEREEIAALIAQSLEVSPMTMIQLAELFGVKHATTDKD